MPKRIRKLSFLLSKDELGLLREACLYGASAEGRLKRAVQEQGKVRLEFPYEELDDLAGHVASGANHETSSRKQARWDALAEKLESLLRLADTMQTGRPVHTPSAPSHQLQHYIFEVRLEDPAHGKVMRKIQIAQTKSLYNFARVITHAFGFFFDHCFGFYDNFTHYHDSTKAFELFADIGEEPLRPTTKGVKNTKLQSVFKRPGDKMLFLFDYGDGWRFVVELKDIQRAERRDLKPIILERVGKAPLQYPPEVADESEA